MNLPVSIEELYSVAAFPFLGDEKPNLTQDEFENLSLEYVYKSASFDLNTAEQKTEFEAIMSNIYNGKYKLITKEARWPNNAVIPTMWLEWVEIYSKLPEKVK